MNDQISVVQIPGKAVSDKTDVREPVRELLQDLYLLGTPEETKKAGDLKAAFEGPPQSVAVIEAGATAATKWWSAGLGAIVIATWVKVAAWWGNQDPDLKRTVIFGAAFVTGSAVFAISYLLASDIRGRAAAAVATVQARSHVAVEMIQAAQEVYEKPSAASEVQLIPLPSGLKVTNTIEAGRNEKDWLAIAIERQSDGKLKYLVVKGNDKKLVEADHLIFA
jgi:hypothetical protein